MKGLSKRFTAVRAPKRIHPPKPQDPAANFLIVSVCIAISEQGFQNLVQKERLGQQFLVISCFFGLSKLYPR